MTISELKLVFERLLPHERLELESFLRAKRGTETPGYSQKVAAAQARMDAGLGIDSVTLHRLLRENPPSGQGSQG